MPIEVAASVLLDRPRPVVRRYLISRWVDPDKKGIAVGRVIHAASGADIPEGRAREVLAAFDEAESRVEEAIEWPSPQVFEVEVYGVRWKYELQSRDAHQTKLDMLYVQAGFMARVPGMRTLMKKAMRREVARLQKWAAGDPKH